MSERDFKGVWIPKEIWLNENLTLLEKAIFVEIDSLDNENHCIAGNEYFAEFCNCSTSAVTKAISKLQELKMIEIMKFDGRHRQIRVVKSTNQPRKIYEADSENLRTNNINNKQINNKSISKDIDKTVQKPKQTLYSKCICLIDDFTEDEILRELLTHALKMFLENNRESGKPFYTNNFKGKLNSLKKLSDDNYMQRKIVQQTLDKGWNDFYELKTDKRQNKTASSDVGRTAKRMTAEEKQRFREEIASGKLEKF